MRMAGRVAAAIEILTDVFTLHRPASEALKDWGKYHRFAGSTDRHAIGTLVYDVLRRRNTAAARMGDGRPRALALGVLRDVWHVSAEEIENLCTEQYGPGALSGAEKTALAREMRGDLPARLGLDYAALKAVLETGGWSEDTAYDPTTHKRALLNAAGLSADARRALGGGQSRKEERGE